MTVTHMKTTETLNHEEDVEMSTAAVAKSDTRAPAKAGQPSGGPVYTPRVDIRETETDVLVVADMPGVDEKSVSVDVEGSELRIAGTFVLSAPEGYSLSHHEYTTGTFARAFSLGDQIDRAGIRAVVANGVLELTLPKAKVTQVRKIKVKAA